MLFYDSSLGLNITFVICDAISVEHVYNTFLTIQKKKKKKKRHLKKKTKKRKDYANVNEIPPL